MKILNELKQFLQRILQEIIEKKTWNIRHLVNKSFVSSNKRICVLYCRLSDHSSVVFPAFWFREKSGTVLLTHLTQQTYV